MKWNSVPVLVTTNKYEKKACALLSGTVEHICEVAKVVDLQKVEGLREAPMKAWKLKEELDLDFG